MWPARYVREAALKVLMIGLLASKRDRSRFSPEQLIRVVSPLLRDIHSKVSPVTVMEAAAAGGWYGPMHAFCGTRRVRSGDV